MFKYLDEKEMDFMDRVLYYGGKDYGWEPYVEKKKYILVNPKEYPHENLEKIAFLFCGSGHYEWELFISAWILNAVRKAISENDGIEADVSIPFNVTQLARPKKKGDDYRRFSPEQARRHLFSKGFELVEETDSECRIRWKSS